ncbi:uncharacterized protein LOC121506668 isoform X2 [Cheilinus undulatus]|uniref:uncharacterized protein LOC121506668 isoform X2 n=1 Tax=Cheilinus undulatus TaxID=241271 RepID=UPI001BD637E5|nr:uncharacterized protein LOC121506668 isoform X2 [Cheilinus undulatus]
MPHALQELGLFLLFLSFSPSLFDQIYMAIGGDAVLRPPPMDLPIKNIEWKYNEDIAADWHGNEFECFGQFKGRCEVNTDTGELTIKELNLNDSGIYTPEINYKVSSKTQLSVISRVAKPSVETSCNTEMTNCDVTCEGNTAEAEPITYTWFIDGEHGPSNEELIITKDSKEYSFRCLMMNPVSNETSESITNPIIKQEQERLISILVPVVVVIVLVLIGVAVFFIRERRRRAQYKKWQREIDEKWRRHRDGPEHEMDPLNQSPDGEETESVTPETSNQSLAEAAASNTDQETEFTSVEVPDQQTSGPPDTNKDSEKSALMPDKKPETNSEPSADEQRADDRGDVY